MMNFLHKIIIILFFSGLIFADDRISSQFNWDNSVFSLTKDSILTIHSPEKSYTISIYETDLTNKIILFVKSLENLKFFKLSFENNKLIPPNEIIKLHEINNELKIFAKHTANEYIKQKKPVLLLENKMNNNRKYLDLSKLNNGYYILKIESETDYIEKIFFLSKTFFISENNDKQVISYIVDVNTNKGISDLPIHLISYETASVPSNNKINIFHGQYKTNKHGIGSIIDDKIDYTDEYLVKTSIDGQNLISGELINYIPENWYKTISILEVSYNSSNALTQSINLANKLNSELNVLITQSNSFEFKYETIKQNSEITYTFPTLKKYGVYAIHIYCVHDGVLYKKRLSVIYDKRGTTVHDTTNFIQFNNFFINN